VAFVGHMTMSRVANGPSSPLVLRRSPAATSPTRLPLPLSSHAQPLEPADLLKPAVDKLGGPSPASPLTHHLTLPAVLWHAGQVNQASNSLQLSGASARKSSTMILPHVRKVVRKTRP